MQSSKSIVAGVDEAGRGPLAGPVVACAVVVMPKLSSVKFILTELSLQGLRDSKQLSARQREKYYSMFQKDPGIAWGIGRVSERLIDRINIYQATKLAMERAVGNLCKKAAPDFLYVDGTMQLGVAIPQKAVVRGDETLPLCAMASIVAKVTRDRVMERYHKVYPEYGFDKHKGYGTLFHQRMLKRHGPCKIHRMSFRPCKNTQFVIA